MFTKSLYTATLCAIAASLPAAAAIVQTAQPGSGYVSNTNLIDISAPVDTEIDSVSDGILTVNFSHLITVSSIGSGWATWATPPDVETSSPIVLRHPSYDPSATSLGLSFSMGVRTFGLEAEPDPFSVHNITIDFYNGLVLLGSITRTIDGYAGARLLAGTSTDDLITNVVVSSDADFGIARLRYSTVSPTPEPSSILLMGAGIAGLALKSRRRKAS